jgi:chemotaxis protein CheC
MKPEVFLTEHEQLILQEIMNIAFGSATADLEEILNLSINLKVPEVKVIPIHELKNYILESMNLDEQSRMVEERFWGDFKGSAILVFTEGVGKGLISMLSMGYVHSESTTELEALDQGVLLEVGNILIGACIGKISELLSTSVTYSPPYIESGKNSNLDFFVKKFEQDSSAIILKTEFLFSKKHLNSNLMIITNHESIIWMKESLQNFMESFG